MSTVTLSDLPVVSSPAAADILHTRQSTTDKSLSLSKLSQFIIDAGTKFVSSANYTVLDTDGYSEIFVTTGTSNRTITLPTLADNQNRILFISKIDTGVGKVIIDGEGSEEISGFTTQELWSPQNYIMLVGTSAEWKIVEINQELIPTGTNDDIIIQNAIDFKNANGGGKVKLAEGTFSITSQINIKSNVQMKGQGLSTILRRDVATLIRIIWEANTSDNFELSDFKIDGNKGSYELTTGSTCYGIEAESLIIEGRKHTNIESSNHALFVTANSKVSGFKNCYNLINCSSFGNSSSNETAETDPSGFYYCNNLINCESGEHFTTGANMRDIVGFWACNYLVGCAARNLTGYAVYGFRDCNYLSGCSTKTLVGSSYAFGYRECSHIIGSVADGATGASTYGFNACIGVVNCNGINQAGTAGYGFHGCTKCQQNKGGGNTTSTYYSSYADAGTSNAAADTAAGGYNS